jgi:hypothetical protein
MGLTIWIPPPRQKKSASRVRLIQLPLLTLSLAGPTFANNESIITKNDEEKEIHNGYHSCLER